MANRINLGPPQPTAGQPDRDTRNAFDQRIGAAYRSQLVSGGYRLNEQDRAAFLARMKQAGHRAPERDRTRAMLASSQRQHSRRRGLTAAALIAAALIVLIGWNQDWFELLNSGLGGRAGDSAIPEGALSTNAAYDSEEEVDMDETAAPESPGEGGFGAPDAGSESVGGDVGSTGGFRQDPEDPGLAPEVVSQASFTFPELSGLTIDYPAEILLAEGQAQLALDYTFSSQDRSTLLKPEAVRFSTRIGESTSGTAIPRDLGTSWFMLDPADPAWTESPAVTGEHLDLPFTFRLLLDISDINPGSYNLTFSIGGEEIVLPVNLRKAAG